jgi:hypothetical protein
MANSRFSLAGRFVFAWGGDTFQDGKKACTIPPSCEGKILQTTFLDQRDFYVL